MILTLLSILDITAALMTMFEIRIIPLLVFLAMFLFLKALFSLLSSFARNDYTDWLGTVDLLASVGMFIFIALGTNSFVEITSKLLLFKGTYCLIRAYGS